MSDISFTDLAMQPPVDLSFRRIKNLADVKVALNTRPRTTRTRKEVMRGPTGKFISAALWLNTNMITSTQGIKELVDNLFEIPDQVRWLDLSYNRLEDVHTEILQLPNLKILYLHGNCITNLSSIAKLQPLRHLRSLTLHGCPVETRPFYRQNIIYMLPQLRNLDFVTITPKEAIAPPPPGAVALLESINAK